MSADLHNFLCTHFFSLKLDCYSACVWEQNGWYFSEYCSKGISRSTLGSKQVSSFIQSLVNFLTVRMEGYNGLFEFMSLWKLVYQKPPIRVSMKAWLLRHYSQVVLCNSSVMFFAPALFFYETRRETALGGEILGNWTSISVLWGWPSPSVVLD